LTVDKPANLPNTLADVVQWRYNWADGAISRIRGDRIAFGRLFNPDPHSIRGLSPLVTGTVTATAQHRAQLYSKTFFENNAVPSHILKLPDGVPEAVDE
jgi:phage portal protein BeeE